VAKQPSNGRKTPAKSKKAAVAAPEAPESVVAPTPMIDAIPAEVHTNLAPEEEKIKEKIKQKPVEKPAVPVVEKAATRPPSAPESHPAPAKSGGFVPLVLGGVLAGVIGYAIATFTAPAADDSLRNEVAMQASAISALEERVAEMGPADLSGLEDAQTQLAADIAAIVERLDALEAQPAGAVVTSDGTAVEGEMEALRAQIAEMTGAAQTELAEARAAAASIEENAAAAARNAAGRAALARIQTALESGAPIGAALNDLEDATGEAAPDALTAVQGGVPTLASLQESFPEVAREALATARREGVAGEETTGFGAFLRTQLDVRSTTPQEGDSADAVLSRAEAAVRTGRLADALAELSALPDVARAEMSEWLAQAEARADAIMAVDVLSTSLSDN